MFADYNSPSNIFLLIYYSFLLWPILYIYNS